MYGDALQATGDPRGELVALDLHRERHGETPAYREAWPRAMMAWLGELWTDSPLAPWAARSFRFGFLDDLRIQPRGNLRSVDVCRAALRSPAGRFLRGATITDDARGIREALDVLAGGTWPWLDHLAIEQDSRRSPGPFALAGILGAAVPHLREVTVRGYSAAAAPLPASVQRLVIDGAYALDALDAGSSNVREIDIKILAAGPHAIARVAQRLAPARFPALVHLDLSRCEHNPYLVYTHDDALRVVQVLEAPERLRTLRIAPPVRDHVRQMLAEVRAQLPALAIEIVAKR